MFQKIYQATIISLLVIVGLLGLSLFICTHRLHTSQAKVTTTQTALAVAQDRNTQYETQFKQLELKSQQLQSKIDVSQSEINEWNKKNADQIAKIASAKLNNLSCEGKIAWLKNQSLVH